jgi:hypothetical protein
VYGNYASPTGAPRLSKRIFSLEDITQSQADRFRGYRYGLVGVWDPAAPRWMPNFKDLYLVYVEGPDLKSGRYFGADGDEHWLPRPIFDKMRRFGLLEETSPRTDVIGRAFTYSAWGLEFLVEGFTDLSVTPPTEVQAALDSIRATADVEFQDGGSPPFLIKERNSTLLVDQIDVDTGADVIGMLVTPEATLAVVYDERGLRITDVLVEHEARGQLASWIETFVMNPQSRRPITAADLEQGIRLADLFNLPRERIFQDEALVDDIIQRHTSIFNPRPGIIPQVQSDVVVRRPPGPFH